MKKKELERWLRKNGWYMLRQGGAHEVWTDAEYTVSVPRKSEIKENTARSIMKMVIAHNEKKQRSTYVCKN